MRHSILKYVVIATIIAAVLSAPLLAHHSINGTYDSTKATTITGTVTEVKWMNPHTWLSLEMKGSDGKIFAWKIEMGAANRLYKTGFRKESVVVPSTVTIQVWPARDGSQMAAGRILTLPDGQQFDVHDTFADFFQTK